MQDDNPRKPEDRKDKEDERDSKDTPPPYRPNKPQRPAQLQPPRGGSGPVLVTILVIGIVVWLLVAMQQDKDRQEISVGVFNEQLEKDNVEKAYFDGPKIVGEFKKEFECKELKDDKGKPIKVGKKFYVTNPYLFVDLQTNKMLQEKLGENLGMKPPQDGSRWFIIMYAAFFMVSIFIFIMLFRRFRDQAGGGMITGFGKSPARLFDPEKEQFKFSDVAGIEGVKKEVQEIVDFLERPEKFSKLGGRVPKGVLLVGPPGTGKTLLARSIAGEAGVPFFSINGSEFIQMFVGVGASRVRDMFAQAKANSPSILFIDEIDAVGRHRGTGVGGGNDEREQTLNQILSEMDGFTQESTVIVVAATNRPDVLDPALLRPGRFDRQITVDRPSKKGRRAIFDVHIKKTPLSDDVDLDRLASATIGMTGADIQNLINEAALWATRHDKDVVSADDFEYARDKVMMGIPREEVYDEKEKKLVAYHEAGHTLVSWLLPKGDRVHKVTIIPRGRAGGATLILPDDDKMGIDNQEIEDRILIYMGGRVAELIVFDSLTAGCEQDLLQATHFARQMVMRWGMSEKLGPVAFVEDEEHPFLGKEIAGPRRYSEHTAQIIDEEVTRILSEMHEKTTQILNENRAKLDLLAEALLDRETLDESEITELIGIAAREQ